MTTNVDVDFIVTPPAAVTVTYPTTETVDAWTLEIRQHWRPILILG